MRRISAPSEKARFRIRSIPTALSSMETLTMPTGTWSKPGLAQTCRQRSGRAARHVKEPWMKDIFHSQGVTKLLVRFCIPPVFSLVADRPSMTLIVPHIILTRSSSSSPLRVTLAPHRPRWHQSHSWYMASYSPFLRSPTPATLLSAISHLISALYTVPFSSAISKPLRLDLPRHCPYLCVKHSYLALSSPVSLRPTSVISIAFCR